MDLEQNQFHVFDQIGEAGFKRLVAGFYTRVRADGMLAPLYPEDDWEGAELRLRDFLVGRLGGPQRYVEARGHPRLRMRHARFSIGQAERDRWAELMEASIEEAELPDEVAKFLRTFLGDVATFLINAS